MAEITKTEGLSEAANRYANKECGPEMIKRFKIRMHMDVEVDLYDTVLWWLNSNGRDISDLDSITMMYLIKDIISTPKEDLTEEIMRNMPPELIERMPMSGRSARLICKGAEVISKRRNKKDVINNN